MQEALAVRERKGVLRRLSGRAEVRTGALLTDFCSNDYLGLARSDVLHASIQKEEERARSIVGHTGAFLGSSGSRLLSGNNAYAEEVEKTVAAHHNREASLLFTSGYTANLGLVSSVPAKGDVVLYDALCHNSLIEGFKLGRQSRTVAFRHNSVDHVSSLLSDTLNPADSFSIFVIVESVYSMDGDVAPIRELLAVCAFHGCRVSLIVDEAHGSGVFGETGMGVVAEMGLEAHPNLLCTVHTYGKAFGIHGAAVVGRDVLRQYLINYARPLVFTTSLPLHALVSIKCAYAAVVSAGARRDHLKNLIALFTDEMQGPELIASPSAIQAVLVPGNENVVAAAGVLRKAGHDVLAIRAPTVKAGTERLRVILHAHNTVEEVQELMRILKEIVKRGRAKL